ncbi:hypothetical protein AAVH_01319 [Aphelenchoides avenae]|nr:hypothetical protein AAVH_01319 [Aphelenchus avenae]
MKSERHIVWVFYAMLLVTATDACSPILPKTATMRPGPGAPTYHLILNVTCQGGIAYEYEHQTTHDLCASACQKVHPTCVGVNFIKEGDALVPFKCQIMNAISSMVRNDKASCYKLE